jgi:hypothetical protein
VLTSAPMDPRFPCARSYARALSAILIVPTCAIMSSCSADRSSPSPSPSSSSSSSAGSGVRIVGYTGELPALPIVPFAPARPASITRAAYEFAARHPDVLRHMPCFCGCERNGHGNNEDCFVSRRDADGRPVWSPHGISCGICIDVAREAARLHASGAAVADIRAAIDGKYRGEHASSTPTPPVPQSSAPH